LQTLLLRDDVSLEQVAQSNDGAIVGQQASDASSSALGIVRRNAAASRFSYEHPGKKA
jgi:hypothetical protein